MDLAIVSSLDQGFSTLEAAGTQTLTVRAGGNGSEANPPLFEVFVDGVSLGVRAIENPKPSSGFNVNDDSLFRDYVFLFDGPAPDEVEIRFVNDGNSGGVNRDLVVDFIDLNGTVFESETDGFFFPDNGNPVFEGARERLFVNGNLKFEGVSPKPQPLIVTTLEDETFDGSETPGAPDGAGLSLREALAIANADPETADVITFAPGLAGGTLMLTQGQLEVNGNVTIDGDVNGDDDPDITIDALQGSRIFQVDIENDDVFDSHVQFNALTLTGGNADQGSAINSESPIYSGYSDNIKLTNSIVMGNVTTNLGGAAVQADNTNLSVYDSAIHNNVGSGIRSVDVVTVRIERSNVFENSGHGIETAGYSAGTTIIDSNVFDNGRVGINLNSDNNFFIDNSNISGNLEGGVRAFFNSDGLILDSKIFNNTAEYGGGFTAVIQSEVHIENSMIYGNTASDRGGGLYSGGLAGLSGYLYLLNSQVFGNSANEGGGAFVAGLLDLEGTEFTSNSATQSGGGIAVVAGYSYSTARASIVDSTISGNSAGEYGGGVFLSGYVNGGYASGFAVADFLNSTIAGNTATDGGGIFAGDLSELDLTHGTVTGNMAEDGGGLFIDGGAATARNTLVLGNTQTGSGASEVAGPLTLEGGNIVGDEYSIGGVVQTAGIAPTDVFANGLADNGGPVQTVALKSDPLNPALDAGDDGFSPAADARGEPRLVDLPGVANNGANAADLGAFELQALSGAEQMLTIRAGGNGTVAVPPMFEVFADGISLGMRAIENPKQSSGFDVGDDSLFRDYVFLFDGPAPDEVDIRFFNDGRSGGVNRDLVVDFIDLNGTVFESETDAFFFADNGRAIFEGPRERLFVNGTLEFDGLQEDDTLIA